MDHQHQQSEEKPMSELEKIKHLLEEQVRQLRQKREEVLSKVKKELDDIDRALRQLGHEPVGGHSQAPVKRKRRAKVDDSKIKEVLRSFMKPGELFTGAEILSKADLKASRFANFKAKNRDFLKSHGAKRAMRYSL